MSQSYEILIVDDVSENIKVAINILKSESYNFSYALNGNEALHILKRKRFDLILLDVMMPGISGFDVCKIIKNTPQIADTPVIFLTAKVDMESIEKGFSLGAVDYVTKPFHPTELKCRVINHLELYRSKRKLKQLQKEQKVTYEKHLLEVEDAQQEVIIILSELMDTRSNETANHVQRVASASKLLATLDKRLNEEEIKDLYLTAPLHDIGKILIEDSILHKEGSLSKSEYFTMQKHVTYAYDALKKSKTTLMQTAAAIAHEHHENYDGSGYPRGLVGDKINLVGRIVSIADVFDALTHKRAYKEAWTYEAVIGFFKENRGTKFDPRLVDLLLNNLDQFKRIVEK